MKRILYLLLFVAACKSSSPSDDRTRIALITQKVLNEYLSNGYRPYEFKGDIEHISEVYYGESKKKDGYIKRDTFYREYWFKDHRLWQIASITKRMRYDTLIIRYDAAGRITELAQLDDQRVWNTDQLKYDTAGRRIEKKSRIYSTESVESYEYSETGDSLLIKKGQAAEGLYISKEGDNIIVKRALVAGEDVGSIVYEFNRENLLTQMSLRGEKDEATNQTVTTYNSHGDPVRQEQRRGDQMPKGSFPTVTGGVDFEYIYDNKGNWTSEKVRTDDKNSSVTTRTFTYK